MTLNVTYQNQNIQPSSLWEKIDALMTNAVTKNLSIEDTISTLLKSAYNAYYLSCKNHTVEAVDRSSLEVLAQIEKSVNQQDVLEKINPALEKKALAEAGSKALLALITHDKSAMSCSQADLFDYICERESTSKRAFLYQQRRFATLGKAALSILDEVEGTNQLVEDCKIYLSSELFITELECLAYFNHFITFPFLNCVKTSSQAELLVVLPQLYNDLSDKKVETLKDFVVLIHRMSVPTLSTEASRKIINMMCLSAATAIKLQCGREYGFSDGEKLRVTDLSSLTGQELNDLPTNNIISECDLSRFDRETRVAKSRSNIVLYNNNTDVKIDKVSRKLSILLSNHETSWNIGQQEKLKARLQEILKKSAKAKNFTKRLLQNYKSWDGPCTPVEELYEIIRGKPDQQVQIVKNEFTYFAQTHKAVKIVRPHLFRPKGFSHEEKLMNFSLLLEDNESSLFTVADLPTNDDLVNALNVSSGQEKCVVERTFNLHEFCVVAWRN